MKNAIIKIVKLMNITTKQKNNVYPMKKLEKVKINSLHFLFVHPKHLFGTKNRYHAQNVQKRHHSTIELQKNVYLVHSNQNGLKIRKSVLRIVVKEKL